MRGDETVKNDPSVEPPVLVHARGRLDLDRCLVMGIVNRTPDSFYDGGRMALDAAVSHGLALVDHGADILDLGAVKAGPGSEVEPDEEEARLLPLVEALAGRTDVPLSVETGRPGVAKSALDAGGSIVNDVAGLSDPRLAAICAQAGAAMVLMHNGAQIRSRPRHPRYRDVAGEVISALHELEARALAAGVGTHSLVFDPGLDFGKTTHHSLELVRNLDRVVAAGRPVLVAPSRKDVVGESLGLLRAQRLEGTLALVSLSVSAGASIVRVHDVEASVRTVRMVEAVMGRRPPANPVRGLWD